MNSSASTRRVFLGMNSSASARMVLDGMNSSASTRNIASVESVRPFCALRSLFSVRFFLRCLCLFCFLRCRCWRLSAELNRCATTVLFLNFSSSPCLLKCAYVVKPPQEWRRGLGAKRNGEVRPRPHGDHTTLNAITRGMLRCSRHATAMVVAEHPSPAQMVMENMYMYIYIYRWIETDTAIDTPNC